MIVRFTFFLRNFPVFLLFYFFYIKLYCNCGVHILDVVKGNHKAHHFVAKPSKFVTPQIMKTVVTQIQNMKPYEIIKLLLHSWITMMNLNESLWHARSEEA